MINSMKIMIFLSLLSVLIMCNEVLAKLTFKINELSISNIIIKMEKNTINEELEAGPYIYLKCTFTNNSMKKIKLFPSSSEMILTFKYNNLEYSEEIVPISFIDNDSLIIMPNENFKINVGTHFLLGTPIFDDTKMNYTLDILQILPTIKVRYKDKFTNVQTCGIDNVKILD